MEPEGGKKRRLSNAFIILYVSVQILLPLGGLTQDKPDTRGDFSWNMYSQHYSCDSRYILLTPDGRGLRLDAKRFVRLRRFNSLCHRDRLPGFHAWLCDQAERREPGSKIRADMKVSHNLGPFVRLVRASTEICSAENYGVEP